MIVRTLTDLFFSLFRGLFSSLDFLSLPTSAIQTLSTILVYGNWIVGVDIMILFVGSVVFWWTVHLSIGVAVWLWKMLPLT